MADIANLEEAFKEAVAGLPNYKRVAAWEYAKALREQVEKKDAELTALAATIEPPDPHAALINGIIAVLHINYFMQERDDDNGFWFEATDADSFSYGKAGTVYDHDKPLTYANVRIACQTIGLLI